MQTCVYYNKHMATETHAHVNVNAAPDCVAEKNFESWRMRWSSN